MNITMNERRFVRISVKGITVSLCFVISFFIFSPSAQAKDINVGGASDLVKILGSLCFGTDCKTGWSQITGPWSVNGTSIYNSNTGLIGIGTSTPLTAFDIFKTEGFRTRGPVSFAGSLYINRGDSILMVNDSGDVLATTTSSLLPPGTVTLPTGVSGQTLRHNGTAWISDSNIFNTGCKRFSSSTISF